MRPVWRQAPAVAVWPWLLAAIVVALCLPSLPSFAACDEVPTGGTMRIRLLQPVSSYSAKPGMPVEAMVVESPQCDGLPFFVRGTRVSGRVTSVHRVGLGFRHEAAALDLDFNWISPDNGPSSELNAVVIGVDDARETVKNGVIHGITPADSPQDRLFVPIPLSHLAAWNPYSYWITPLFKAVFPIAPEPEIYFPAGTDIRLQLTAPLAVDGTDTMPVNPQFSESARQSLDELIDIFPTRSFNTKGREADVVNLMFLGSQEQIANAFRLAGWDNSDPVSARSVMKEFHAVLADQNDPHLPMAHHLLGGLPPQFTLEKGLDSYAKRDHLRIWEQPESWQGRSVWLSASTAEIGAGWSFRRERFVHDVNPAIDEERQKIVRDLTMAGCVAAVYLAPRPGVAHDLISSTDTPLRTDGSIAVVQLTNCELPMPEPPSGVRALPTRPPHKITRFVRTEVLAVRNVWRDNPVYAGYEVVRATAHAIPHDRNRRTEVATAALSPASQ